MRVVNRRRWRSTKRMGCALMLLASLIMSSWSWLALSSWVILVFASALACNIYRDEWD
jgi:hypothetical protein